MSTSTEASPVTQRSGVFISYSHADARPFKELKQHLAVVERAGHIIWTDRDIKPGELWHAEITNALARARIAVLLVTPAFVASEYIANHELPTILRAAQAEGLTIFWIPWRAADASEFSRFQAAHPPQSPLATLPRAKRDEALVAIVERLKTLLGPPPGVVMGRVAPGAHPSKAGATAGTQIIPLTLTDELTLPMPAREAVVVMEDILYAAQMGYVSIRVTIPAVTAAREELGRLEASANLSIEERERRAVLRKEFLPGGGFPRDAFLSHLLTTLIRQLPRLADTIRSGSDLLTCVAATLEYRRHRGDVPFDAYRNPRGWSVLFEVPHDVVAALASERGLEPQQLRREFTTIYADEFPSDVRQSRIVPALLWYGGLGMNRVRLEDPELFDLGRLQVSLA